MAAANWAVIHVGTPTGPGGPRLLPVWPGLAAPSGVFLVGLSLLLRDAVHELAGRWAVAGAVAGGAALSAVFAPAGLVAASAATFAVAEGVDWLVYARLRRSGRVAAAAASNLVGAGADTALFLALAFGAGSVVQHGPAQMIGKMESTIVALAAAATYARLRRRLRTGRRPPAAPQVRPPGPGCPECADARARL